MKKLKCPYRKRVVHHPLQEAINGQISPYDEEGFMPCYGTECPFYDEGTCRRVKEEVCRCR